ncbi:MAG: lactate/malate family dehydrogenase, partial [Bacteroidota bacterium]
MKVTVIGAGNVGATCANVIAHQGYCNEVVLLDIKEGIAEGKALDIWRPAAGHSYNTRVNGVTNDYSATAICEVVVL